METWAGLLRLDFFLLFLIYIFMNNDNDIQRKNKKLRMVPIHLNLLGRKVKREKMVMGPF